jgi:hypothetical protein
MKEPLMTTKLPEGPWQQVGWDLFEWEGKHCLLVVDLLLLEFSRIKATVQHQSVRAVIAACQEIFSIHGIKETLFSDNGS